MERVPTGVSGFDELVGGGFPRGSITLVSGSPGTGKSIFSQQFVYTGATKYKEKALYVSLEQRVPDIYEQAAEFGWDFEALEKQGRVKFVFYDISQRKLAEGQTYVGLIKQEAQKFGAKRIVVDSLSPLANFPISVDELAYFGIISDLDRLMPLGIGQDLIMRMQVHRLVMALKDTGATTILISEIPKDSKWFSRDKVSEFLADGVIVFYYLGAATDSPRTLIVEKMRGTKHAEEMVPFKISDKGLACKRLSL